MVDRLRSDSPGGPELLDGWKAIAEYLGKSVRTAQRYHRELSLPVYHRRGLEKEGVYALREELEAWQLSSAPTDAPVSAPRASGCPQDLANAEADGASPAAPPQQGPPVEETEATSVSAFDTSPLAGPWWRQRTYAVGALVLLALVVASSLASNCPSPRRAPSVNAVQPSKYEVGVDRLQVFDSAKNPLWSYPFPGPLSEGTYRTSVDPRRLDDALLRPVGLNPHQMPSVQFGDIDGDGNTEVLFVARHDEREAYLVCFSWNGRVRWVYRPSLSMSFGGTDEGVPQRVNWVWLKPETSGIPSIWVEAQHTSRYAAIVESLSANGEAKQLYWSNGHVISARAGIVAGREWIFLGGANNELRGGFLAILDPTTVPASAPAQNSAYRCDGCPSVRPAHFFVFPSTRLCGIEGGMAAVSGVSVAQSGQILVNVRHHSELLPGSQYVSSADSIYTLSPEFRLVEAEFHSGYLVLHRYYETLGRLTHSFLAETHRDQLFPVLRWDGRRFVEVPLQKR